MLTKAVAYIEAKNNDLCDSAILGKVENGKLRKRSFLFFEFYIWQLIKSSQRAQADRTLEAKLKISLVAALRKLNSWITAKTFIT